MTKSEKNAIVWALGFLPSLTPGEVHPAPAAPAGQVRSGALESLQALASSLPVPEDLVGAPVAIPLAGPRPPAPGTAFTPLGYLGDRVRAALRERVTIAAPEGGTFEPAGPVAAEFELAGLDRHWTTTLTFPLAGGAVSLGGVLDRNRNLYLGVFRAGWPAPQLLDVASLADGPAVLVVKAAPGADAAYSVKLAINVFNPKASRLELERVLDPRERHRAPLEGYLEAVYFAGRPVKLGGQEYRVYYAHDAVLGVRGPGIDPQGRSFAFLLREEGGIRITLVAAESVPLRRAAVFTLPAGRKAALSLGEDSLKVFAVP